jgi:regulatory protein
VRTVTGLREKRHGWVVVELDGNVWRTVPIEAVARVGLTVGLALDRPRLRLLARELRRSRALATAAGALRRRDLPLRALDARLQRAGVAAHTRREALETLRRAGFIDDERFATGRAEALAERGYGDAAIRWRLEQEGVAEEVAVHALAALEPEAERARRLLNSRHSGRVRAALLARRGFSDETIESALGPLAGADT